LATERFLRARQSQNVRERGRECQIVSPMCEGACIRDGTHWQEAFSMRDTGKPIADNDKSYLRCVPYCLHRHGAYDLAGRVEESFCLDSLITFSLRRK